MLDPGPAAEQQEPASEPEPEPEPGPASQPRALGSPPLDDAPLPQLKPDNPRQPAPQPAEPGFLVIVERSASGVYEIDAEGTNTWTKEHTEKSDWHEKGEAQRLTSGTVSLEGVQGSQAKWDSFKEYLDGNPNFQGHRSYAPVLPCLPLPQPGRVSPCARQRGQRIRTRCSR